MSPTANSKCYKCHDPVWIGLTEKNKNMPMNIWTSPRGTYYAVDPENPKPMVHYIGKDTVVPEGSLRYFPHFITCRKNRKSKS